MFLLSLLQDGFLVEAPLIFTDQITLLNHMCQFIQQGQSFVAGAIRIKNDRIAISVFIYVVQSYHQSIFVMASYY